MLFSRNLAYSDSTYIGSEYDLISKAQDSGGNIGEDKVRFEIVSIN
jgi:hypothetical protein